MVHPQVRLKPYAVGLAFEYQIRIDQIIHYSIDFQSSTLRVKKVYYGGRPILWLSGFYFCNKKALQGLLQGFCGE